MLLASGVGVGGLDPLLPVAILLSWRRLSKSQPDIRPGHQETMTERTTVKCRATPSQLSDGHQGRWSEIYSTIESRFADRTIVPIQYGTRAG